MLEIIICDDDSFTLQFLSGLAEEAIWASGTEARIVCLASSGNELLNFIKNSSNSFLYFLDFDFGKTKLNGIDLARRIYRVDLNGKIVFVTSHTDKGIEILKSGIRAFGFIEKSPERKIMIEELKKYLKMAAPSQTSSSTIPFIELPLGIDETVEISILEITYVDSVKTIAHSICYHTFDGSEITVRDTIENAQKLLGRDFLRCHRCVLVNKNYVVSIKNGLLKLSNGKTVACAIGKKKSIIEACFSKEMLK